MADVPFLRLDVHLEARDAEPDRDFYPCGEERARSFDGQVAHYGSCCDLGCQGVNIALEGLWFAFRRAGAKTRRRRG